MADPKRVLLIDADSTIPNLALMKLSAWHKSQGDSVSFNEPDPTLIYASIVFKRNRWMARGIGSMHPDVECIVGGSGHDLKSQLPVEVEAICPDYFLYPFMDYSLGFTSRGCVRNCYFCIVPEKEGKYRRWQHPQDWVRHPKAKLLDNNWYADREWFKTTSEWFIEHGVAVDVTQGMDIRLLTSEIAQQLKRLEWCAPLHFAYDDEKYQQAVFDGIQTLKAEGFEKILRHSVFFYVYCHDDAHYESALARCRQLKEAGTSAFVMFNCDNKPTPRIKRLQRWANKPWLFWSIDIKDYNRKVSYG